MGRLALAPAHTWLYLVFTRGGTSICPICTAKRDSFYGTTSPGDSDQLTVQSFTVSTWPALLRSGVVSHLVEQRVVFDPRRRRAVEEGTVFEFVILAETGCQTNFLVVFVQQVEGGVVDLIWTETQRSHMV